jgi:hypothetical protein
LHYTIYKITNLINGKIYIGKHQTKNIDDGYMGSGNCIKAAILKYGIDNFSKEILSYHDTEESMNLTESLLVNKDFINRNDTYNLVIGGGGSFSYINENKLNLYGMNGDYNHGGKNLIPFNIVKQRWAERGELDLFYKKMSMSIKELYKNGYVNPFFGKTHSAETKEKQKNTFNNINHQQGSKNSQYGTKWIHNKELKQCKKVPKDAILDTGWEIGRVIKW